MDKSWTAPAIFLQVGHISPQFLPAVDTAVLRRPTGRESKVKTLSRYHQLSVISAYYKATSNGIWMKVETCLKARTSIIAKIEGIYVSPYQLGHWICWRNRTLAESSVQFDCWEPGNAGKLIRNRPPFQRRRRWPGVLSSWLVSSAAFSVSRDEIIGWSCRERNETSNNGKKCWAIVSFLWMRGLQAIELCWTCLQALAATVYCFIRLFEALGCHSNTRSADVCVCACVCNGGVKSDGERNRPQFPPVPVLGKWVKGKTKVHLFHFPHTHKPTQCSGRHQSSRHFLLEADWQICASIL